jgi:hypothetical protein
VPVEQVGKYEGSLQVKVQKLFDELTREFWLAKEFDDTGQARLVESHLKGSFHELMGRVRVRTAKRIEEVRDALVRYRNEVRELSTLRD